jgi:hypothetical protein
MSANLRRYLSNLQRDLIAARTVTAKPGGDRNSMSMKSKGSKSASRADGGKPKERTIEVAAAMYHLSEAGVRRARHILDLGIPEFIAAIDSGNCPWLSVTKADEIVTPTTAEKLDGVTSAAKQREWLRGERLKKRVNPPLGQAERFQRSWGYLSFEGQKRFVIEEALPFLIAQARLDGLTEIALPDATILLVSPKAA